MTKVYFYTTLILISIFSSCSLHDVEDDIDIKTAELEYVLSNELSLNTQDMAIPDFAIENKNGIINEGDQLEITNSSLNAVSYHWDFGNGDVSTKAIPEYTYDRHGDYTVKLTISDKFGNTKELTQDITVLCVFVGNIHTDF